MMTILENGEIVVEKDSKKAAKAKEAKAKEAKAKKKLSTPTKNPTEYAIAYSEDLVGTVKIELGIFTEEFVDPDGKKRPYVELKGGYSVHISEYDCSVKPNSECRKIYGVLDKAVKKIDKSTYEGLCRRAVNTLERISELRTLAQDIFVNKPSIESDLYMIQQKDDLWFFTGKRGEADEDLQMYLETDLAYRVSDSVGRVTIYKGFDIYDTNDFKCIARKYFNSLVDAHTASIRSFKGLRDACRDIFKIRNGAEVLEKLSIDSIKMSDSPEALFEALDLQDMKVVYEADARRADYSNQIHYKCYVGFLPLRHSSYPLHILTFADDIVTFLINGDFLNPIERLRNTQILKVTDFRGLEKSFLLPIEDCIKNAKTIRKNLEAFYKNNSNIFNKIDWSDWKEI